MTQRLIPRTAQVVTFAAALFAAPVAAWAATALVVNNRDEGPGSFRHAIERANQNSSIDTILFLFTVRTIYLESTVDYTGTQPLTILGQGATLEGSGIDDVGALDEFLTAVGAAFRVTRGADLAVSNLTVRNAPGEGIALIVPAARLGTVRLWMFNVEAVGNRGHGVLLNDEEDPRTFEDPITGDPIQPDPDGSAASVDVTVLGCRFVGNGFGGLDRDGLRVNEGGEGSLRLTVRLALAHGNGADGIEVDERGAGDVHVDVFGTQLTGNGSLTEIDYDDGFDIDEYNDGDLRVNLLLVEANGNREEAIDYEEDDDFAGGGDLVTTMTGIRASGSGVDGGDGAVKIREKGDGLLWAALTGVETIGNDYDGVNIREDSTGNLVASLSRVTSRENAGDGISFDERSGGALTATIANSTAVLNDTVVSVPPDVDIRADGNGTLDLTSVTFNTSAIAVSVTVTVTP